MPSSQRDAYFSSWPIAAYLSHEAVLVLPERSVTFEAASAIGWHAADLREPNDFTERLDLGVLASCYFKRRDFDELPLASSIS